MTKAVKREILHHLNFLKSIGCDYHEQIEFYNNELNSNNLPNSLDELKTLVNNCYLCELSKSRKNVLFGEGNKNASLMFISDEPTATEDELKSHFVGKNGEQLAKMIENVLPLKKEDIYITSLVKCKSKDGMNASHFSSCSSYLYKEIELVNPKLVVALGEKVYSYLSADKTPFNQVRGKIINFKSFVVLPTFSVSYLLRNPSLKREAFHDMLKIKSILESN
ncbi:uracil-DNA glycosylase [Halarcobacter ebronensis]|uniref:Uracil-DNA glycosylase n=1 Tax=Halarcobacter ebronensis TaxID=1462615 RepID=A0A4Q1AFX1_9BACT|nr:uracil-DNA glycosylase [Halarcobacter ebronensis]QKF81455.1 uracil-DNA glycosylase, family 4 [Halarcobacter ebronensis]RXJ67353.1 uracil-DNA glycosylase [Halarcobacter ebronensis]RXK02483.1 uracil-DNA glycosylase [Halarcobacter ebronensis]